MTKSEKRRIRQLISQELDKDKPDKKRLEQLRDMLIDPEKLKQESEEERINSMKEHFRRKYRSEMIFDIKDYIELREKGKSRMEISNIFGIELIILEKELRRARARGLIKPGDIFFKTNKQTDFTKEEYLKEKENGLNEGEIQRKHRLSANRLVDLKRSWGIRINSYKEMFPFQELEAMLLKGYSVHDLATELKVTVRTVYNILRRHNITKKELFYYRNESKKHVGGNL